MKNKVYNVDMKEIRQPQQERSTEKKNKIILAAYEVFSEIGYYSANTAEIAKRAGVSTGIVYSYFSDKKDILLYVLNIYTDKVATPIEEIIDGISMPVDYTKLVSKLVDKTIEIHRDNAHLHNALHALATADDDVNAEFIKLENTVTDKIVRKLSSFNEDIPSLKERAHLAMNLVQSFAHEAVFDMHDYLDYQNMQKIVIETVVSLFKPEQ